MGENQAAATTLSLACLCRSACCTMPAEKIFAGAASDTPVIKKRKISCSPLLATPTRVLEQVKNVSAHSRLWFYEPE